MVCGISMTPAISACLRCFIAVLNIVLGIYAVLIFLFSMLFFLWMDYYLAFTSDISFTIITFLLSISGSIFCFSCLACCCLIRINSPRVLSYLYSVSIGSILFVELVSVFLTFIYRSSLSQALQEGILVSMKRYGMNTDISRAVDMLQSQAGCCGVSGPGDWSQTSWGRGHRDRLPHSCCLTTKQGICNYHETEAGGTELYTQGCHTLLVGVAESYAFHVVSFLLLTILVHSLAVLTACAMARVKGNYSALS